MPCWKVTSKEWLSMRWNVLHHWKQIVFPIFRPGSLWIEPRMSCPSRPGSIPVGSIRAYLILFRLQGNRVVSCTLCIENLSRIIVLTSTIRFQYNGCHRWCMGYSCLPSSPSCSLDLPIRGWISWRRNGILCYSRPRKWSSRCFLSWCRVSFQHPVQRVTRACPNRLFAQREILVKFCICK